MVHGTPFMSMCVCVSHRAIGSRDPCAIFLICVLYFNYKKIFNYHIESCLTWLPFFAVTAAVAAVVVITKKVNGLEKRQQQRQKHLMHGLQVHTAHIYIKHANIHMRSAFMLMKRKCFF